MATMENSTDPKRPKIEFYGWGRYYYDEKDRPEGVGPQMDIFDLPKDIVGHVSYVAEHLVINEIVRKKFKFSGDRHQRDAHGTPIILVDGKKVYFTASMRGWGGIMADAWNEIEQCNKYIYMDFYMDGFGEDYKTGLPVEGVDVDEDGKAIS